MKLINPDKVSTTINTIKGIAKYSHTEIEDQNERWDDHWQTNNGELVIHEGNNHHVYLNKFI